MSGLVSNLVFWSVLAAIPPSIVLLYFLKLRRQPLEVPSTYLWRRTIEDLHVNSFWQRLRRNLLMFLQLAFVLLLILACLKLGWRGSRLVGNRFVFLVDTSASMSATDVEPTRLDAAKQAIEALINEMSSGDVALLISFSDVARVEQQFTDNRRQLRRALANIRPTHRTSDLGEALRAASGLANPGSTGEKGTADVQVADAQPATLYIFSDGGFAAVPQFQFGHLTPVYQPIGLTKPNNVGIVAFRADRNPDKPEKLQAFARIENHGDQELNVPVELHLNGRLLDTQEITIAAGDGQGVQFDLAQINAGVLELKLDLADSLLLDNSAHATVSAPRPAKVLLVSPLPGAALELAMSTPEALRLANVSLLAPSQMKEKAYLEAAEAGTYDLIVYDQCAPEKMPQANTLFVGQIPPVAVAAVAVPEANAEVAENPEGEPATNPTVTRGEWKKGKKEPGPRVLDAERSHPLMQFVNLERISIAEGWLVCPPAGGSVLVDSDLTPPKPENAANGPPEKWGLLAIAPRGSYEDVVLGFEIASRGENGGMVHNTDWPIRLSFPIFVKNVLEYLGGTRGALTMPAVQPGKPVVVRPGPVDSIRVASPSGREMEVQRQGENAFVVTGTDELGVYDVFEGTAAKAGQQFAVNLCDSRESDLTPRAEIYAGHEAVAAASSWQPAPVELWKWLALLGLGLLLAEWYIYNKRIFL